MVELVVKESLPESELREASAPHGGEMLRVDGLERPSRSPGFQQELLERELLGLLSSGIYVDPEISSFLAETVELSVVPQADLPNPYALLVALPHVDSPEILINGDLIESEALFIKMYDLDERQRHYLIALALLPSLVQDGTELYEFEVVRNSLNSRMGDGGNYLVPMCEEIEFLGLLAHLETVTTIAESSERISSETGISTDLLRRVFNSPALGVLSRALLAQGGFGDFSNGQSNFRAPDREMADRAYGVFRQYYHNEFSLLSTPDWASVVQELRDTRLQLTELQSNGTSVGGAMGPANLGVWALMSGISPTGLTRLSEGFLYQENALSQPEVVRSALRGLVSQRLEQQGVLSYFEPLPPPPSVWSP